MSKYQLMGILSLIFLCLTQDCLPGPEKDGLDNETLIYFLNEKLKISTTRIMPGDKIISNKSAAIRFAEMIFLERFGKGGLRRNLPLQAVKYKGYWLVTGTLPVGAVGGTATIIFSENNCKIIELSHYK